MSEPMVRVWRMTVEGFGSYVDDNPDSVADMIRDMDEDSKYTVECLQMPRSEYDALPEFEGF